MKLATLKAILIAFTIFTIIFSISYFLPSSDFAKALMYLEFNYHFREWSLALQLVVQALFIWKIWKNEYPSKRKNWENTLMVIFLGFIGMWFLMVEWQKFSRTNATVSTPL